MADSNNGYVWNWQLYTGKETTTQGRGLAHRVVLDLVNKLAGKGFNIYVDNFYTSLPLFRDLVKLGFGACGTVRCDRKGLSDTFKSVKLSKGETYSESTSDEYKMLCLKWKDKRDVSMVSSFHDDTMIEKRRRTKSSDNPVQVISKPQVVEEYNQSMGGIDKADQMVLYYGYAHRTTKWWKRVFFHLVDLCLVNTHILYNETNTNKLTQLEFRIQVATELLEGYQHTRSQHYASPNVQLPLRLTERPFPEPVPSDTPYGGRPQCEVCHARGVKRSQTKFRCKNCKVPLHIHPCFEIFHTKLNYKST